MSVDIGERIRALRTARGLSQEEVARRTGIGLKSYGDLERGRTKDPHYSTLRGVARALEVRVEELLEAEETTLAGKAEAPLPPGAQENKVGGAMDPGTAAATIRALITTVEGLAAAWNRDVELYEQHERDLRPYRTMEMGSTVVVLYQQFWGALEALQRDAQQHGHSPDISTWDPRSRELLLQSGSSIRALAELYDVIDRGAAEPGTDRDDLRAIRKEFDASVPVALTSDPEWPTALEKARTAVGLA
jgi:transcriptional regulator with XRE-family HTH domain